MKSARYIVAEEHPEGTYLFRYAENWEFAGDTWHTNLKEAIEQAEYEFSFDEFQWRAISETELIQLSNRCKS